MMALSFLRTSIAAAFKSSLLPTGLSGTVPVLPLQSVRYASKKAGGSSRNKIGRAKRKYYGVKVADGAFVHKGERIVKQFGLKCYPGENVIMDHEWSLRAAHDGIVVHSTEQVNPYPNSPLYAAVQNGLVMNKRYFSVIPTPLHGKFKLVSET